MYGSALIMNVAVAVDHVTCTMTSPPGERERDITRAAAKKKINFRIS